MCLPQVLPPSSRAEGRESVNQVRRIGGAWSGGDGLGPERTSGLHKVKDVGAPSIAKPSCGWNGWKPSLPDFCDPAEMASF